MLDSLFIMTTGGEVVIEKHWRSKVPRSVADDFYTSNVVNASDPREVQPVILSSRHCFVHVLHRDLLFVAVLTQEAPCFMVLEILHRIVDTLERYFGQLSDETIRDNFVVTYTLLEETIDDGFPMTFEPTLLRDLVPPPSLKNMMQNQLGSAKAGPTLDMSVVPWRKHGIRYANNEIFFDVCEELHAILDKEGKAVCAEVMGKIETNCRLTGMPDMLVQFNNSDCLDDVSFHPCVRYSRYEQDRSLHFIPPDGSFTLMNYRLAPGRNPLPPFYVQPTVSWGDGTEGSNGRITLMVGFRGGGGQLAQSKQAEDKERNVQDLRLTVPLPQAADSADCTPSQGKAWYDYATREVIWDVGKLQKAKASPTLTAVVHLSASEPRPTVMPPVLVDFKVPQVSYSNLKIDSVTLLNEKYRPYKGVRSMSRAGKVIVRT